MFPHRITHRYAKALLDLSKSMGNLETTIHHVRTVDAACENNRNLVVFLKNPIILPQKKLNVLSNLFKKTIDPLTWKFMEVIVRKNRAHYLPEIFETYIAEYKVYMKVADAKLYTALAASSNSINHVTKMLEDATSWKINVANEVKPEIIGGYVVRLGDKLIDASVASKLKSLEKELTA